MEELITVAECAQHSEAHLLRSRLEAEGLRVYISNENMNTLLGLGSIRVQVPFSDSFRAMDILYEQN